jgi:hypothetical protein
LGSSFCLYAEFVISSATGAAITSSDGTAMSHSAGLVRMCCRRQRGWNSIRIFLLGIIVGSCAVFAVFAVLWAAASRMAP